MMAGKEICHRLASAEYGRTRWIYDTLRRIYHRVALIVGQFVIYLYRSRGPHILN